MEQRVEGEEVTQVSHSNGGIGYDKYWNKIADTFFLFPKYTH